MRKIGLTCAFFMLTCLLIPGKASAQTVAEVDPCEAERSAYNQCMAEAKSMKETCDQLEKDLDTFVEQYVAHCINVTPPASTCTAEGEFITGMTGVFLQCWKDWSEIMDHCIVRAHLLRSCLGLT